ncbi:enoyl-CoA hydratase/isomerase family protein [Halocatena salina]|uniref:Enoyl-CoA hydratase-related protein n=1 Tax=Halocatena salina TaxID=2934340 RepID=A0A8U0A4L9_9EURY|nr:enoyl-CoA hydratase-related protein [Halocatena salina]UPM42867.1 enoyl-CoA hydratase-related protein [Halocatena salina]
MSAGDFETIRIERPVEHLGTIVLDRPDAMNSINTRMLEELEGALERLEASEDVRAVMMRGSGNRAFSAGADVQSSGAMDHREGVEHSRLGQRVFGGFRRTDLPVVAAIDGYCLGGGLELSMCADIRVASEDAEFGLPEHELGLLPGWGGTQRLQRLIGESAAKQIVFTADRFSADRMHELGYLYAVFDAEAFDEAALEVASDIAAGPPIAQRYTKRAMRMGWEQIDSGLELEAQAFGHLLDTEDLAAGITAFVTDDEPAFEGK